MTAGKERRVAGGDVYRRLQEEKGCGEEERGRRRDSLFCFFRNVRQEAPTIIACTAATKGMRGIDTSRLHTAGLVLLCSRGKARDRDRKNKKKKGRNMRAPQASYAKAPRGYAPRGHVLFTEADAADRQGVVRGDVKEKEKEKETEEARVREMR